MTGIGENNAIKGNTVCILTTVHPPFDTRIFHKQAKAMGERARKLVLKDYTGEKNAEKTIQVYEEVLNAG